ncbi:unnamed protein product [Zymoseptoria tritici ST99CH_1A5]|uniref:Uncharacterized protein n=2 Tax=Zymoseptoria tritici TaxID=1047171 RepID=A0A1X7RR97_ZYMT9|nr:unnamed protein product [Zymoseptoria tritici ST99CH_3D7]SMY23201.1 unnamed protein product [Zymoseptoria tritici ST99CH_1A5]
MRLDSTVVGAAIATLCCLIGPSLAQAKTKPNCYVCHCCHLWSNGEAIIGYAHTETFGPPDNPTYGCSCLETDSRTGRDTGGCGYPCLLPFA